MFFDFLRVGFLTKSKVAQGLLHVECGHELRHHRYGDPSLKNNWEGMRWPLPVRSMQGQIKFMKEVVPWLEQEPAIEKYAWLLG